MIRLHGWREYTTMNTKRFFSIVGVLALLTVGVSACGSSKSDSSTSTPATTTQAAQKPVAQIDALTGVQTQVTLDPGFVSALTSLKVAPAPVGSASISKAGVASFPITGGNVTYYDPKMPLRPYVQGKIEHNGSGLSLTAGGTKVELTDFVVDPGTSVLSGKVSVNGKVAVPSAPLFILDGSTLKPLQVNAAKTEAVLEGTTVKLEGVAADLLNKTFKISALKEGLVIGIAKITVALPS